MFRERAAACRVSRFISWALLVLALRFGDFHVKERVLVLGSDPVWIGVLCPFILSYACSLCTR